MMKTRTWWFGAVLAAALLWCEAGRPPRVQAAGVVAHILSRNTLQELTNFGDGGQQPGQFYGVHSIASDARGNLYTTETYRGQRVQRFVYKGLAPVTTKDQGVLWQCK